MPRVQPTAKFDKALRALGHQQRARAAKSIEQFLTNPRHRSLNFEKIGGTEFWTIRVDRNFRIVLKLIEDELYALIDCGDHDYIYRTYG